MNCMCSSLDCRMNGCAIQRDAQRQQFDRFMYPNPRPTLGWKCPSCQTIYAPSVRSCDCATGKCSKASA